MIKKLKKLCKDNLQILSYLFFGVCTTVVNTVCYWLFLDIIHLNNLLSTIMAWLFAVIFAFLTNKTYVFKSKRKSAGENAFEILSFFACRIATGLLDVAIMVVAVDILKWNGLLWKIISNFIVTVVNYVASKYFIFKNKKSKLNEK